MSKKAKKWCALGADQEIRFEMVIVVKKEEETGFKPLSWKLRLKSMVYWNAAFGGRSVTWMVKLGLTDCLKLSLYPQ